MNVANTICSGCMEPVRVNVDTGVATMKVPSNGRRGSLHVPAHTVSTDEVMVDDDLARWDCPRCGYADSVYTDPTTRKALA